MQQFKAILIKRFHHARRSKKGFFSQILLPAIFVIMSMVVSLIRPPREGLPSLTLSTSMYGKPNAIVLENLDINMFSGNLTKAYIEVAKARYFNHTTSKRYWEYEKSRKCDCSSGNYECPANSYSSVKTHPTAYGDTLYDITGGDMNDYLLKTTAQFKRKRLAIFNSMFPSYRIAMASFHFSYRLDLLFPLEHIFFGMVFVRERGSSAPILKVIRRVLDSYRSAPKS